MRRTPRARGPSPRDLADPVPGGVGGAVVDEDDLHVPVGAVGDRAQTPRQPREALGVEVDRNDDRDEVAAHAPASKNSRTAATTASTCSSVSIGWMGSETSVSQAASETGKSPFRAEERVGRLQMQRHRVVHGGLDSPRREVLPQGVPLREADRVEVPRGHRARPRREAIEGERRRTRRRSGPAIASRRAFSFARNGSFADRIAACSSSRREFHPSRLGEVAAAPAVLPESAELLGDRRVGGGDGAAVAVGAEVLGRIEGERGGRSEGPGRAALEEGAVALGAVLDERQPVRRGERRRGRRDPRRLRRDGREGEIARPGSGARSALAASSVSVSGSTSARTRPRAGHPDAGERRTARVGRQQDAVLRPGAERPQGEGDGLGPVGAGDDVRRRRETARTPASKARDLFAEDEPAALEHPGDGGVDRRAACPGSRAARAPNGTLRRRRRRPRSCVLRPTPPAGVAPVPAAARAGRGRRSRSAGSLPQRQTWP